MLQIQHDTQLKSLTTFKIGGPAHSFVTVETAVELDLGLYHAEQNGLEVLILGGGSNMLVSDRGYPGIVIQVCNRGIEIEREEADRVWLRVAAGEIWDNVVQYTVDHGLWGIENLSRIPGRSGAFVVQNVGAYGAEAREVTRSVDVYDRKQRTRRTLTNDDCRFSYRKSIFNTTEKERFVVLSTEIELSRTPNRRLTYPDVTKWFEASSAAGQEPTQHEIREAIKSIRDRKFPFPAESVEGNAGSFFKNSIVDDEQYEIVERYFKKNLPDRVDQLRVIRHKFPTDEGIKIPTAFVFDACGLKGFRIGNVMLNPAQPVVLLNETGHASATEVLNLVDEVRKKIKDKTSLHIYTEPELIGFTEDELRSYGFIDEEIDRYIYGR
jgi:UDP-N-acetylmuramate dehydrogenase